MSTPTATGSTWTFDAIGTSWAIDAAAPLPSVARDAVSAVIERFDRQWSRFRDDSLVTALAEGRTASVALPVETDADADADADAMFSLYDELDRATAGAVNPLVGDSLARLGYDARLTLAPRGDARPAAAWRDVLSWSDGELALARPATVDVGAVGKGRLVDLVLAALALHVDGDLVVDASGDLAVRGAAVPIGLEHPYDPTRAIGVVTVENAALCASAINRRPGATAAPRPRRPHRCPRPRVRGDLGARRHRDARRRPRHGAVLRRRARARGILERALGAHEHRRARRMVARFPGRDLLLTLFTPRKGSLS